MFYFLFRFIGGLIAAAVIFFVVMAFGVIALGDDPSPALSGVLVLGSLVVAVFVFVRAFRRLGTGRLAKWREESQIRKLKAQAVSREIGRQATLVADVLGGGSYATATLRASWDERLDTASVDAVVQGAWCTVFTGRFHSAVAGQVVPSTISPSLLDKGSYSVSTRRVGHEPAHWEVLAYIPGDWEEELERLSEEAKQMKHEREKDRFGL